VEDIGGRDGDYFAVGLSAEIPESPLTFAFSFFDCFASFFGSSAFFSSFFFAGDASSAWAERAPPLLSVLYHPLPLKCTAGGAINFSTRLLLQVGQAGLTVLPNGRVHSKTCWHARHWKSKVGIDEHYSKERRNAFTPYAARSSA